eukprot:comp17398_c0_seq1/m.16733 comp17398_c0_seq1/g.16733  ORF comp17398_c0_seq1/g.16733 comp17398_c0_seq1/m.16733 type:complete len:490 (-) comp17398_c0_seq1:244-1713(-)
MLSDAVAQHSTTTLVAAACLLAVTWWIGPWRRTKYGLPVVGWELPFIGAGLRFGSAPYEFLQETRKEFGETFVMRMGGMDFVFLSNKKDLQWFFTSKTDEVSFWDALRVAMPALVPLTGLDEFTDLRDENEQVTVHAMRKHVTPTIGPRVSEIDVEVQGYMQGIVEDCRKNGGVVTVSLHKVLTEAASLVTANSLVGPELSHDPEFLPGLMEMEVNLSKYMEMGGFMCQKEMEKATTATKKLNEMAMRAIQLPSKSQYQGLIRGCYNHDDPYHQNHAKIQFGAIMFAATANTPYAAMLLVLQIHSEKRWIDRLNDEIVSVCGVQGLTSEPLTRDQIDRMVFLRNCVKETMRMYPSSQVRITTDNVVLPGTGASLPKDQLLMVHPATVHYDANIYPDPQTFNPDRWIGAKVAPMEYLSWGRGMHMCAGMLLAEFEIMLIFLRLMGTFDLHIAPPHTLSELLRDLTYRTPGLPRPAAYADVKIECRVKNPA